MMQRGEIMAALEAARRFVDIVDRGRFVDLVDRDQPLPHNLKVEAKETLAAIEKLIAWASTANATALDREALNVRASLRATFAAHALQGLLAARRPHAAEVIPLLAWSYADAMFKARNPGEGG